MGFQVSSDFRYDGTIFASGENLPAGHEAVGMAIAGLVL
jgi:hypothetical protein